MVEGLDRRTRRIPDRPAQVILNWFEELKRRAPTQF
jgi:hypothetical protein